MLTSVRRLWAARYTETTEDRNTTTDEPDTLHKTSESRKMRRICCEETNRARQARIDEMSMQQERNPTTVSQLLTQIQDYKTKQIPCQMRENFTILNRGAALERPTFPANPLIIPSPRDVRSRDSGLPHNTRKTMGTSGTVFEGLHAREGPPSALFENSKNLTSVSGRGGIREPQSLAIPAPRFNQDCNPESLLSCWKNFFSHGMMDYPRFQISDMHLGKFLT